MAVHIKIPALDLTSALQMDAGRTFTFAVFQGANNHLKGNRLGHPAQGKVTVDMSL